MIGEAELQASPVAAFAARILDGDGEVVGAGFVVGAGQVATCAHVVSAVLGGSPEDPALPRGRLCVDLPLLATPHESEAIVRTWRPIDPATGVGDVAVLELVTRPPAGSGVQLPPLFRPDRLWGHRFRVLGFPAGMQDGVWTGGELRDRQGTRWLQLQTDPGNPPVAQGFSGAPVWDEEVEAVVGMTVASDLRPGSTTAYLVPIEDVFDVDPVLLPNPYRGLEPFGEEHADTFHGRDDEVAKLSALVERQAVVAVVGRSGTGKSSLVRAGLLPHLRRRGVHVVELRTRPADPSPAAALDRLATTLTEAGGAGEQVPDVVVFADQFEELVGTAPPDDEATPAQLVLSRLLELVRDTLPRPDGSPSLRVVLTLRWEAMNELLTGDVVDAFEHGTLSLVPMRRDQLRDAVVGPAARAPGLRFDDGLVERILDDAVGEPGQLPLVESLLAQLWAARRGATLKAAAYEQAGGVKGAVARHAEQVVALLVGTGTGTGDADDAGDADDGAVRRLFTGLARPDEAGGFVRRPARLEGLPADQQALVEHLAGHRLLVVGREPDGSHTVELAHQALIDHWPRLRGWLDDDRDFLQWRHEVDGRRQAWDRAGHDPDALLRGVALVRAEEWLERRSPDVPTVDRAYVAASRRHTRRESRRRRSLLTGLGVVAVMALVLGTSLVYQRRMTDREQADSDSRALATLSADTAPIDPALAVVMALAAYDRSPTPEAENALFRQYVAYRTTDTVLSGVRGEVARVDASRDGRLVAAMTVNGTATTWLRRPGEPVQVRQLAGGQVFGLDVADDGRNILVRARDGVHVDDAASGRVAWEIPVETGDVSSMALGPDGTVALRLQADDVGLPGTLEVWAPGGDEGGEGGHRTARLTFDPDDPRQRTAEQPFDTILGFGPQGTVLVEDNPADIDQPSRVLSWDPTGAGDSVTTVADDADALGNALAADGVLVMCRRRGTSQPDEVTRLDLRDGAETAISLPVGEHCGIEGPVVDAGATLVAADFDVVADLRTGDVFDQGPVPLDTTTVHGPIVADGGRALTLRASADAVLLTEVPAAGEALPAERSGPTSSSLPELTHLPGVHTMRVLPDGEHVLGVSGDDARLIVARTDGRNEVVATADRSEPRLRPPMPAGPGYNAEATLVADRVAPDRIEVRRLPGLEPVSEMTITTGAEVFDPSGQTTNVVHWSFDRFFTHDGPVVQWWDPLSGDLDAELDLRDTGLIGDAQPGSYFVASYVDRDHVVLTVVGDPEAHILEVDTGRQVGTIPLGDDVLATKFQTGSRYVTILRQRNLLEMWDRVEARRVLGPFPSLGDTNDEVSDVIVQFLPEPGDYLLGDRQQLRWYEAGDAAPVRRLDLGAGRLPISSSHDGSVVLFLDNRVAPVVMPPLRIDPAVWRRALCDLVDDRSFGPDELAQLPPGTPRQPCG